MEKVLGIGLLGWGKFAQKNLAKVFPKIPGARWVAIGTREPSKAEGLPPGVKALNYEDFIQHPEVDAIHISLPNHLHLPWSKRAIQEGKHVLCEKPFSIEEDDEDLKALLSLAKSNGLLLAEAFMYRHHQQYQKLWQLLGEGRIGEIQRLDVHFTYRLSDRGNIRWKKDCQGGALADVGCYGLNLSRWVLGPPDSICGLSHFEGDEEVDSSSSWLMKHQKGTLSRIHVSMNEGPSQHVLIKGEKGEIEIPHAFIPGPSKKVHLLVRDKNGQEVIKVQPSNPFLEEWNCFIGSIKSGALMPPLEDGLENSRHLKRIFRKLDRS